MIKTFLSKWLMSLLILLSSGERLAAFDHVRIFVSESAKPDGPAKENAFWVGQKVPVIVEVLSETHFSGSTRFSLPDIAAAVFYKPEERAIVMSREIDGATYSVQRHEFSFYPQRAGEFTIPAFSVRFGIAGALGAEAKEYEIKTKPLPLKAIMPPGAENLHQLISTTDLKVTESWTPNVATLNDPLTAGNAIKRSITFRAPDMPGMAFPKIHIPQTEGLKIYRNRADVNDKINRGALVGERIDSLTYVCQEAGNYQLPEIQITWWDLDQQQLKTITLPEVSFDVKAAPHQANSEAAQASTTAFSWEWIAAIAALMLISCGVLYRFKDDFLLRWAHWQQQRSESEAAYFKLITADLPPSEMLFAIQQWLKKISSYENGQSFEDFAKRQNNPTLQQEWQSLQSAIVGQSTDWDGRRLIDHLKQARQKINRQEKLIANNFKILTLNKLNPK